MASKKKSAAYFSKTDRVAEFLTDFVRVRKAFLDTNRKRTTSNNSPYRRSKKTKQKGEKVNESDDDGSYNDNLLDVATQMLTDSDIHLDAFISLVVVYGTMEQKKANIQNFELSELLRDTRITHRKFPKFEHGCDIASSKRIAEELEYQRHTQDIREMFTSRAGLREFKPPIISGTNTILGVALTFLGAYSISGSLGVENTLYKATIGIGASLVALIVDTLLYLTRTSEERKLFSISSLFTTFHVYILSGNKLYRDTLLKVGAAPEHLPRD